MNPLGVVILALGVVLVVLGVRGSYRNVLNAIQGTPA